MKRVGRVATIDVGAGSGALEGALVMPPRARGVVVFADGTGSVVGPRDRAVARALSPASLATLLIAPLPAEEEADLGTAGLRFDVGLLGERVVAAIDWLALDASVGDLPPTLGRLPVGCFGAGEGTAAALIAAARRPHRVAAVVSRGGRPDLAGDVLTSVTAPTLLIVGGRDTEVLRLNRRAQQQLPGESRLEIVPGARHLFEEPGALGRVAAAARDWFVAHLVS